jgi:hypothetical protein
MMRRQLFLTFACLTFFVQTIYAQDIILKRTGDEIKAKVAEISTEYVKYKKFENPTGPVHNISVAEIFMIKYEDGSRDVFEKDQVTGQIRIKHSEAERISLPQVKRVSNGIFEMLAFDGASVSFRAVVETPVYSVSQVSDGRTIEAVNIRFKNGVAAQGSSLQFGVSDMLLSKDAEVLCSFENVPAGFIPQTIVFLTGETAAPMSYDVAAGEWIKPKQIAGSTNSSGVPETSPNSRPQNSSTGFNTAQTSKTRPLTVKCVNDLKSGTGVPNTKIHLAYYDKKKSKWVVKSAAVNTAGIAKFDIPTGEDNASYAFLVALTEEKLKQLMKDVNNNRRYMMRMPDGTMELELWITANGEGMTNKTGSVQMWSK